MHRVFRLLAVLALALPLAGLSNAQESRDMRRPQPAKVIIDTDFNTIGDDGQVLAMAAQLDAAGAIELMGVTVASGNQWLNQGVSDALKAVERLGIERSVKVYAGAPYPLLHDYLAHQQEKLLNGAPVDYVGAFAAAPTDTLVPPPDGFATHTRPAERNAAEFIIDAVRRHPHEVTILAIAPPTNLAMAIRLDPGIVPLIKQVVTMAGQVYVGGNAYLDNAEFNWWFDPEATRVVLRAAAPHVVVPLDATNTLPLTRDVYLQIAQHRPATPITKLFRDEFAPFFGSGPPPYLPFIFDTAALAYLADPTLATDVRELWLDVNTTLDRNYGKAIVAVSDPYPGTGILQKSKVVFRFDNPRFYAWYADLLTRPVPVRDGRR